jgi:putative transposase
VTGWFERCTVERLMRELGLEGADRWGQEAHHDRRSGAARMADHVGRRFSPARPDAVWVADFTNLRAYGARKV